jgi:hypothetical protein
VRLQRRARFGSGRTLFDTEAGRFRRLYGELTDADRIGRPPSDVQHP